MTTPITPRKTLTTLPRRIDGSELFEDSTDVPPEAHQRPQDAPRPVIGRSVIPATAPANAQEAEQRFWTRYGPDLGIGTGRPQTVQEWTALATQVRSLLHQTQNAERKAQNDADPVLRSALERSALEAPTPSSDPLERIASAVEALSAALKQGGVAPARSGNGGSAPKIRPHYDGEGRACCPYHADKPLAESQYGGVYCKAKGGPQPNDKGYCSYSWKD